MQGKLAADNIEMDANDLDAPDERGQDDQGDNEQLDEAEDHQDDAENDQIDKTDKAITKQQALQQQQRAKNELDGDKLSEKDDEAMQDEQPEIDLVQDYQEFLERRKEVPLAEERNEEERMEVD